MSKSEGLNEQIDENHLQLAIFVLKKKFKTPYDMIRYWSITGPCVESHPDIEKYYPTEN